MTSCLHIGGLSASDGRLLLRLLAIRSWGGEGKRWHRCPTPPLRPPPRSSRAPRGSLLQLVVERLQDANAFFLVPFSPNRLVRFQPSCTLGRTRRGERKLARLHGVTPRQAGSQNSSGVGECCVDTWIRKTLLRSRDNCIDNCRLGLSASGSVEDGVRASA
jgi:hypothetical protein